MHTPVTPFTLHRWREGKRPDVRSGWRGTSPEFGEIVLTCPLPRVVPESVVTEVRGGLLPVTTFESRGIHVENLRLPTLNRATLRVGDRHVRLARNRIGATLVQRALQLRHAGDTYRLAALDRRGWTLTRAADEEDPGVTVTVRESGRGKGASLAVRAEGRAEGADLAMALVFAGVDRSALTRVGAVKAGVRRVAELWAEAAY
ncbi:hypothetical protein AB0A60_07240 [Streptomyces sp. NPDC046275]|uniref:hypothetical protein n=1 Tax=Streptomyces sp. NPDC046275 TaxID=3157201 RepID=UPI0033F5AED9